VRDLLCFQKELHRCCHRTLHQYSAILTVRFAISCLLLKNADLLSAAKRVFVFRLLYFLFDYHC